MVASDAEVVQTLWKDRFGGDASTRQSWVDAALDPDRSATGTVAVPSEHGPVVAFGFLEIGDDAYARRYLSLDPLGLAPPLAAQNGMLHLYCVRPDWEGQGIGTALYARHLRILAERTIPLAFGIAWHRPHTVDSRVLFEKHGFRRLDTVKRYYDRFEERSRCPDCGANCSCTASLYTRKV
jgi:GNAT superfamily N-acetyltransferase